MTLTNSIVLNKSAERRQIESFMNFITMSLLLYLNYNTTFYIHILTSTAYRSEVKQLVLKLLRKKKENDPTRGTTLRMLNQIATAQQAQTTSAL